MTYRTLQSKKEVGELWRWSFTLGWLPTVCRCPPRRSSGTGSRSPERRVHGQPARSRHVLLSNTQASDADNPWKRAAPRLLACPPARPPRMGIHSLTRERGAGRLALFFQTGPLGAEGRSFTYHPLYEGRRGEASTVHCYHPSGVNF